MRIQVLQGGESTSFHKVNNSKTYKYTICLMNWKKVVIFDQSSYFFDRFILIILFQILLLFITSIMIFYLVVRSELYCWDT